MKPGGFVGTAEKSALVNILTVIQGFLDRLKQESLKCESAKTQSKYPKYLSKFALLGLQLNDMTFRITFLMQILIFLQTLQHPLVSSKDQVEKFTCREEETEQLVAMQAQVVSLLEQSGEATSVTTLKHVVLNSEPHWLKWKANKC